MTAPANTLLRDVYARTRDVIGIKSIMKRVVGTQRVVLPEGTFDLNPGFNSSDRDIWLNNRHPEPASLAAFFGVLPTDRPWCIFDIGGNSGTYSVPIAQAAPKGSTVKAFEPNPVMAKSLRQNLALNGLEARVTLHEVALGAEAGEAEIGMPSGNMGQGSLRLGVKAKRHFTVPVRPLADFAHEVPVDATFAIKIDVEGYEDAVLLPFLNGLGTSRVPDAILIEVISEDAWEDDLFGAFAQLGYRKTWEGEGNALYTLPR